MLTKIAIALALAMLSSPLRRRPSERPSRVVGLSAIRSLQGSQQLCSCEVDHQGS